MLDVRLLMKGNTISPSHRTSGTIAFDSDVGTTRMEYECDHARELQLRYHSAIRSHAYSIPLVSTEAKPFGGRQYWFECPNTIWPGTGDPKRGLPLLGEPYIQPAPSVCGRRVGKLYMPPGWSRFACRQCCNLTYLSSQRSHCRPSQVDDLWSAFGSLGMSSRHAAKPKPSVRVERYGDETAERGLPPPPKAEGK
jgi:hypothetical protein